MASTKKALFGIVAVLAIVVLVVGGYYWWQKQMAKPKELTRITFATVPFIGEAASYVAYNNGYFEEEGLDVTLKYNPGGWMSLKNLFEGDADIATVAELPIVYSSFDKKKYTDFERGDFYIIGDIVYSDDFQQVVARKDKGVHSPADVKGKTVGVFRGTTLDFFMDFFFTDNRIEHSDVEIVDMDVFEMTSAIERGDLDVIFTWQPHVLIAQKKLGDNAIVLPSRLRYTTAWLIVVMKDYAEENPEILEKFLRAIVKAENFIKENPEEAISIHAKMSDVDRETVAALWDVVAFDLSISESLLTQMEEEARWLIRTKRTDQTEVPNLLDYIYFDALEKVKPAGITVIR
ncbi:MAG: NrtA/SsuA/CpmA family ABC transporter substrate-binding protein [Anaerolineales bacterium]|nr:NrtA/SsuA/CpmA family ABC transporter substrate-binding protein [Anaerolineales bacterium]